MTRSHSFTGRNPAKLLAAFALHQVARMRLPLALALALLPVAASAQTPSATTTTCNAVITANIGLLVPVNGSNLNIASNANSTVFGLAECQCHTTDISEQLQLTVAIPASMANGALQLWVGTGCDQAANRVANSMLCEMIMSTTVTYSSFVVGSSSSGFITIPIPSDPLFNPAKPRLCSPGQIVSNDFFLLFAPTGDFSQAMSCTLNLQENTQTPNAPTGLTASPGDGAVTLTWSAPIGVGEQIPNSYQVLCADANGNPIPGKSNPTQAYSVCINGQIFRRNNFSTAGTVGTVDGGTTTTTDAGTMSEPLGGQDEPLYPEATGDAGAPNVTNNPSFSTDLNPGFICSGEIKPAGMNLTARIDGLNNNTPYQFIVVSIDTSGNPTPSAILIAAPQPTEDLWKRFRDEGGNSSGFCFIATAAFGSYEDRYVRVLRDFRDDVLLPTRSGQAFVDWYYAHSPPAAAWIADHMAARIGVQLLLWPVIGLAAFVLYTSAWVKALVAALVLTFFLRKRMRKAVARV
jgi:hypothetical protein